MSEPTTKTETKEEERPRILYSDDGPEPPFPLRMEGVVISGFGRGSKEVCITCARVCQGRGGA